MIWTLVPLIGTALCWLLSLRRTPYAAVWAALSAAAAAVGVVEVLGAVANRDSLSELVAVSFLGSLAPSLIAVSCTEVTASDDGAIREWRDSHRGVIRRTSRWRVITKLEDSDRGRVWVGIKAGAATRWLGNADPATDLEAFIELRTRAEDAADTMNRLKIGSGT